MTLRELRGLSQPAASLSLACAEARSIRLKVKEENERGSDSERMVVKETIHWQATRRRGYLGADSCLSSILINL